jgi:DNA-binding MarR family transcriptional regulator
VLRAQEFRVAIGRLARRMRQLYAEDDVTGPSFTEVAVLVHVARDGATSPSDLAGRERVTSQAISAVIRDLEARGLVGRTADPADGRRTIIDITDAGRAVLRDREASVMAALLRALDQDLTPAERGRLEDVVPLLNRLADRM